HADEIPRLASAPVPALEMLDGLGAWTRQRPSISIHLQRSGAAAEAWSLASGADGGERWTLPARALREGMSDCREDGEGERWVTRLLDFASKALPYVEASRFEPFFAAVESGPCLAWLPAEARAWFELVRAVSRRDAAAMSARAAALLSGSVPMTPERRSYLLQ